MSDNIPFDIQMEIIKKVSIVKSLIRFRSVSKPWKSFIDSSDFIKGYGARYMQPHSLILSYRSFLFKNDLKFICLIDDDNNETFKVQQKKLSPFVVSPLFKQYRVNNVGACHGLLCLYGFHTGYQKEMFVIWNPSIGKSFGIAGAPQPGYLMKYGFGVCPVTKDPILLKIKQGHVEVFTLSSRVWSVISSSNILNKTVRIDSKPHVVIDRLIYWGAWERIFADDGEVTTNFMVVSFDLITKKFKVVDLPNSLRNELDEAHVSVSKLRGSLVVYGSIYVERAKCCGVWMMEHDSSFSKLFTIRAHVSKILGFSKSGETIFEIQEVGRLATLYVYDPHSQKIENLGISGVDGSFFMGSYKESLLLLDHSDLHIYSLGFTIYKLPKDGEAYLVAKC